MRKGLEVGILVPETVEERREERIEERREPWRRSEKLYKRTMAMGREREGEWVMTHKCMYGY